LQFSTVQGLPSSAQTTGVPFWQAPVDVSQVSTPLQAWPSSHGASELQQFVIGSCTHMSLLWSHLSRVHTTMSSQVGGVPPTQFPVLPSQVSRPLQKTSSSQCFGVPEQPPLLQVSFSVQGFPSSQGPVLGVNTQWPVPGSQLSSVQGLSSSQTVCGPGTQWPSLHVSFWVQAFPSLHEAVLSVCVQPLEGSQPSSVHGLPSLQSGAGPLTHAPSWQVSPCVHALLSLQLVPFGLAGLEQVPVVGSQVPAS